MIRETLDLLCPGAPVEIRVISDKPPVVQRFNDHDVAAAWVEKFPTARGIYTVLNPYDDTKIQGSAVNDEAITRRHWLLIDADPERPKGLPKNTNATDVELGYALTVIERIKAFLTTQGWPAPVEALSGNGGHLLYRIDLPNDAESLALITGVLKRLETDFNTPNVKIDQAVSNASRITKLYGTMARKGPESVERPVRVSMITKVIEPLGIVPTDALRALILEAPSKKKEQKSRYDISKVLARVEVLGTKTKGDVTYYTIRCPWDGEHSIKDDTGTVITIDTQGRMGFKCLHGHCKDRTWKILRDYLGITTEDKVKRSVADAILIQSGRLTEIVDQAEASLLGRAIYQRGGQLTRAIRLDAPISDAKDVRREVGSTMLIAVKEPWLIERMGQTAIWLKYDQKEDDWTPADPPPLYARTLLGRAEWKFPVLRGVITAPTLTRDGQIIENPGFDEPSGLLIDIAPGIFDPVPRRPTKDDAAAALDRLSSPLRSFPFVDMAALSVALSGLLCGLTRFSMRTAPLHSYDAPTAGTGKSLLAEMVGLLATGVRPPAMSQGKSEEEDEKRLSTVLFAGDPVIHIDNCERPISGDFLCSMLTQEVVQARILGLSERRVLPSTSLVLASGNNLIFAGDTSRRAVVCRLDAEVERPDTRTFDFDCHAEVLKWRPQLVVDALTVLLAYHLAGRPEKLTPMGSFNDWEWIRGALVWLDRSDPADTRLSILANDPKKDELITIMEIWEQAFGAAQVDVAEIERLAQPHITPPSNVTLLRNKLIEICGKGGGWSGKSVGWWLVRNKDRVIGGKCFRCIEGGRTNKWLLFGAAAQNDNLI